MGQRLIEHITPAQAHDTREERMELAFHRMLLKHGSVVGHLTSFDSLEKELKALESMQPLEAGISRRREILHWQRESTMKQLECINRQLEHLDI